MKKSGLLILILVFMGIFSCNNPTQEKVKTIDIQSVEYTTCDEFLEQYEVWIDKYLEVIDAYFNNPSDETNASQYMELMQEGIEWSGKWEKLVDCADNKKYKSRFEEVSKEVEKKLKEMGL